MKQIQDSQTSSSGVRSGQPTGDPGVVIAEKRKSSPHVVIINPQGKPYTSDKLGIVSYPGK